MFTLGNYILPELCNVWRKEEFKAMLQYLGNFNLQKGFEQDFYLSIGKQDIVRAGFVVSPAQFKTLANMAAVYRYGFPVLYSLCRIYQPTLFLKHEDWNFYSQVYYRKEIIVTKPFFKEPMEFFTIQTLNGKEKGAKNHSVTLQSKSDPDKWLTLKRLDFIGEFFYCAESEEEKKSISDWADITTSRMNSKFKIEEVAIAEDTW